MRTPKAGPKTGAEQKLSFIEFQLPSLSDSPPEGDGWIHEIKHDGYRTQLIVERGQGSCIDAAWPRLVVEIPYNRRGCRRTAGGVGDHRW